jgi:hypothetical protein
MARLPKGWTRLKTIGDVEPIQVLINRNTGRFGTQIGSADSAIREWDNLADAESFIKEMNERGMVEAVLIESHFHDEIPVLRQVRLRRVGHLWVKTDGSRLEYRHTPYVPNLDIAEALNRKRDEFEAARKALQRIREEAYALCRGFKELQIEAGEILEALE